MQQNNIKPDIYQLLPHKVTAKSVDYAASSTPRHSHPRAQLIYAASGVMRIETDEGCWVVPPLRGVWIPPEMMHTVHMLGSVEMRTLYIRPDIAANFQSNCCLIEVSALLRQLILSLTQEAVDYEEEGRAGLIAQLALMEIKYLKTPALHLPLPSNVKLMQICQQMIEQPSDQTTIEIWADQLAMSSRTLARKFEKETGLSFRQWRQQAKLIEALERLAANQPISQVAQELGYLSSSAFTAMFKRVLGVEPSRYFES
ncbi:helix-turn-helix transcriptional regulator [Methylotenera sp.]|uniref:AraC family transcriptional regulator n=1 Tax=Methylotenera sp. TaxID=2051956 RepID=UPI0024870921|nr:helix-turn-helix transcriptional regulator [Methylotenera sp.]MDI1298405.1 helix-turn-helix transcriptional regulator [Methylotenera sp.]